MGRSLLSVIKTIITVVIAGGIVVASFYFAYLLLLLIVLIIVGIPAWYWHNRTQRFQWFEYEDSD